MPKHEHKFEIKLGVDQDVYLDPDPNILASGDLHVYAECKCGHELDRQEIEHRINTWEECK